MDMVLLIIVSLVVMFYYSFTLYGFLSIFLYFGMNTVVACIIAGWMPIFMPMLIVVLLDFFFWKKEKNDWKERK